MANIRELSPTWVGLRDPDAWEDPTGSSQG